LFVDVCVCISFLLRAAHNTFFFSFLFLT
jgi:hypothetical protein